MFGPLVGPDARPNVPSVGSGPSFGPSNLVGLSSTGPNFVHHFNNVGPSNTLAPHEPVSNCVRFEGSIDHGQGFRPIGGGESRRNMGHAFHG